MIAGAYPRLLLAAALLLLSVLHSAAVQAHKPSDSYLFLSESNGRIRGRWDIAVRDLEAAVGLDADGDGQVTWDELRRQNEAIRAYASSRLTLQTAEGACRLALEDPKVVQHSDGAHAALGLELTCPGNIETLQARYSLLFDIDAQHRGVLRSTQNADAASVVFTKARPEQRVDLVGRATDGSFANVVLLGIEHILHGYDHLLFLIALLLPSVLRREGKRWLTVPDFRSAFLDVLRIVTAFTIAHSLTLALAALRWVELPSRWVEPAIALSVMLAALNNLYPVVKSNRWVAAFGLGLLHGFGFAATLADLGMSGGGFVSTLFGFNLGVELGQIAVVTLLLPLMHGLSRFPQYPRLGLGIGSWVVFGVSLVWLVERVFDLQIIS